MTQQPKRKLNADDWIKAAFRALTAGGVQAIRVEAIAREMGTSKGSFYWHFRDSAALKDAMLEHWRRRATEEIISANTSTRGDAADRLQDLIAMVTDNRGAQFGGIRAEAAMREWARVDEEVATAVRAVDQRRLEHLQSVARDLGHSRQQSVTVAQLLYAGLIGLEYLETQDLARASLALQALGTLLIPAPSDETDIPV